MWLTGTLSGFAVGVHEVRLVFLSRGHAFDLVGDFFRQHDGGRVEITVGNLGEHGCVNDAQVPKVGCADRIYACQVLLYASVTLCVCCFLMGNACVRGSNGTSGSCVA